MTSTPLVQQMQRRAAHPLFPGIAIAGVAIGVLMGVYFFEYVLGLKPCPLCLEQRPPWFILIALGGAIAGAHTKSAPRPLVLGLYVVAALVALWSAYLGLYHAGVEYKWWLGPPTCTGELPTDGSLLGNLSRSDVVFCDEPAWTLLGVSLAGFNFLFSLLVAGIAAWGAWRAR